MPNHYDIDIYCIKCNDYMYSYRDEDPLKGRKPICKKCKRKSKEERKNRKTYRK
jgi:hypothetical protein